MLQLLPGLEHSIPWEEYKYIHAIRMYLLLPFYVQHYCRRKRNGWLQVLTPGRGNCRLPFSKSPTRLNKVHSWFFFHCRFLMVGGFFFFLTDPGGAATGVISRRNYHYDLNTLGPPTEIRRTTSIWFSKKNTESQSHSTAKWKTWHLQIPCYLISINFPFVSMSIFWQILSLCIFL